MTDNIKLPPMPKPHTPPVFATAANTQSVKAGYELGGYEKTPPLFDEHQLEAYAREAVRLNATVPNALEKELLQAIQERDAADDYIDALLDEVLGTDRQEWSSVYGHSDAMEQVRERMNTLMKPSIDKAWDRFQSAAAPAAPAAPQPAQPLDLGVMELAESVGLIGPASRADDLHEAIQRFHDLIVVNASIKAALHFADGLAQPAQTEPAPDWAPTPENINSLPEPVRRYIAELETNCDPAGTVRDLSIARDTIRALEASNRMLRDATPQPSRTAQPLTDEKEALDLLNSENDRLTRLVLAYRGQRNPHRLAEKLSDMMTFAGCSLTEYQQAVLAAGLRALLEPRTEDTQ